MRKPSTMASLPLLTLALAGCQTTTLQSAWFDPSFTGGPMHRIGVVAVGVEGVNRRMVEDVFAQRLRNLGVNGVAGWSFIPDEARGSPEPFNAAVRASGAEGLLVVRLLGVDTQTHVNTMMVTTSVSTWGGPTWGGARVWATTTVPVTQVSMYNLVMVETTLYEVATERPVWAGITQTLNPSDFQRDVTGLADVITAQLRARRLLGTVR